MNVVVTAGVGELLTGVTILLITMAVLTALLYALVWLSVLLLGRFFLDRLVLRKAGGQDLCVDAEREPAPPHERTAVERRAPVARDQASDSAFSAAGTDDASVAAGQQEEEPQALPTVVLAEGVLPVVHGYIHRMHERHGRENEAGGILVGTIDRVRRVITVCGFVEAGPQADFSATHIDFDSGYQTDQLRALGLEHPEMGCVGCIHSHPGAMDSCSAQDLRTDRAAVISSQSRLMVFGIVTLNNPQPNSGSLAYRDFTLNFFLLGECTGFAYAPVTPVLADLPAVSPHPVLALLSSLRGRSLTWDWRSAQFAVGRAALRMAAAGSEVVVEWRSEQSGADVMVVCRGDRSLRLFTRGSDLPWQERPGPWNDPEAGAHIWISHLLALGRQFGGQSGPLGPCRAQTKRVVPELGTRRRPYSEPRNGERSGNCQSGRVC